MKHFYFLFIFLFAFQAQSQTCIFQGTAPKAKDRTDWDVASNWSCGFVPNGSQAINDIVIAADVVLGNNTIYDFTSTSIASITIQSGSTLTFGANSQIILPSGAEIIVENGGTIDAGNNSSGTLIEIGGNGVWGRQCEANGCTNDQLAGPLTVDENSSPGQLPVELIYFTGEIVDGIVELEWSTASEENFNFFTVERSLDGVEFTALGNVLGKGGDQINYYSYSDDYNVQDITYYRLKATDYDGFIEYHPITAVYPSTQSSNEEVAVYPNPLTKLDDELVIDLKDNKLANNASVRIFSTSGKLVFEQDLMNKVTVFNDLDLESGLYVAKIQHVKGQYTLKLVVE
ncbi:T9SS type A sorting domain-containing protein [Mangrovivirga cuniculi]|nr:T9SS type A sorting domain-containing protein [Mangrovivirga cuniculi]